jgi:hypothetical protein
MSTLDKIGKFLQQGTSAYQPSPDRFPPIDAKRLEDELQLVERARLRGRQDQPASSTEGPDIVEQEILHRINDLAERARSIVLRELKGYSARIGANTLTAKSYDTRSTASNAATEYSIAVRDGSNRLVLHLERFKNIHAERSVFRQKNRLRRPVEEPTTPIFAVALILLIATFETALNTSFFARGNEAGLLGGLIESLVVTLVNVGFGFVAGRAFWPWINHINSRGKAIGWSLGMAHFGFSLFWNLFVAQYRLALQSLGTNDAGRRAMEAFLESPLQIADFQSIMMVLLGTSAAVFAAYEAYKMQDPYPLYSKIESQYKASSEKYAYYQNLVIQDLKDVKDEAIKKLSHVKDEVARSQMELEVILGTKEHLLQEYGDYVSHLSRVGGALVTSYRDINTSERTTAVPAYFNKAPIFGLTKDITEQQDLVVDMQEQSRLAGTFVHSLNEASEKIFADFHALQNRFPLLEDILKESGE